MDALEQFGESNGRLVRMAGVDVVSAAQNRLVVGDSVAKEPYYIQSPMNELPAELGVGEGGV